MQNATDLDLTVQFHHIHVYVNKTKSLQEYKDLEEDLNKLAQLGHYDPFSGGMRFLEPKSHSARVSEGKEAWQSIRRKNGRPEDMSSVQDFVEQLIIGLGWRVTAYYRGVATASFLVTSSDPRGVKICVTSIQEPEGTDQQEPYQHFDAKNVQRFLDAHNARQGISVLGFEVGPGQCSQILERYRAAHPALLVSGSLAEYTDTRTITRDGAALRLDLGAVRILEAYAFYSPSSPPSSPPTPDRGTVLRFIERAGTLAAAPGFSNPAGVLPGLADADPRFDGTSIPAYSDHWVSNVADRAGFLRTLADALGFAPKVDFNAGVIAAGAASIESTVVGNAPPALLFTELDSLRDQTQVFLPVNNALSPAGHVHAFLAEIGQGVQHVASRVADLVAFVERVTNYRGMTGGGLAFLDIPRSYYGVLSPKFLAEQGVPPGLGEEVLAALVREGLADGAGIVDLAVTPAQVAALGVGEEWRAALAEHLATVQRAVERGRYSNLYGLLGERMTREEYEHTVQNRILVDIQGEDILLQIFTCKVLQQQRDHEAPFLEFIQRVCQRPAEAGGGTRPGCGGFGIRNFLTLFLSIELAKAMADRSRAREAGDAKGEGEAQRRMDLFSRQLEESDPLLTAIADAMRDEGRALDALARAAPHDPAARARAEAAAEAARARKADATARLQALSRRFDGLMGVAPVPVSG